MVTHHRPTHWPGTLLGGAWLLLTVGFQINIVAMMPAARAAESPSFTIEPSSTVIGLQGTGRVQAVWDADGPSGAALPQYLDDTLVTWSSANLTIARVADGHVAGLQAGLVTISGTYQGVTASSQVKVAGRVEHRTLITPDGRTRSYLLYVPAGYQTGVPTPLVFVFHGGGGNGQGIMNASQMNAVADQSTVLIAYPDGIERPLDVGKSSWNAGGCCGYAQEQAVDDVGFTRALVTEIGQRYTVDPERLYATGISNGAMLSHRLACELADTIAAIAPVAGGMTLGGSFTACQPSRKISVIEFHGTTEDNYPYEGGVGIDSNTGINHVPIPTIIAEWLARNGINPGTKAITYQHGIETCETPTASTGEQVTLCTARPPTKIKVGGIIYDGGGHAWPGGLRNENPDADVPTQDISASAAMWDFFARHPKTPPLIGDLDGNGLLDLEDVRQCIYMLIGQIPPDLIAADLDHDGQLLLADLQMLIKILVGIP
jgi:polyhydroxybutyrate depolymerase